MKPCPFCIGKPKGYSNKLSAFIKCTSCGYTTSQFLGKDAFENALIQWGSKTSVSYFLMSNYRWRS